MAERFENEDRRDPMLYLAGASFRHGTEYGARICRDGPGGKACDACRDARNEAQRRRRQLRRGQRPIPAHLEHGRYVHEEYACDCEICITDTRIDNAIRQHNWRKRRKEAS